MKILRVDMENEKVSFENLREEWKYLGGSALIAKIMNEYVPPNADPLGPENAFIVAVGPLAGTAAPQLGRVSVGAKSPLTMGIKESNSGGPAGQLMDVLGIRAIVVEGKPREKRLFCLLISKDQAGLVPADEYRGMKNYELVSNLRKKYGKKAAFISTGLAGELKYKGASVSFTDIFGDPSRNAARGGLGAVMGSKGLKAIVIDPSNADPIPIADSKEFRKTVKSWVNTLKHDISCNMYARLGTPFAISNSAAHGTLPANNYRSGRPDNFITVSGNSIQKLLFDAGVKCTAACRVVFCSVQSCTRTRMGDRSAPHTNMKL